METQKPQASDTFTVTNPVTNEVVGTVPQASLKDLESVITRARKAQAIWGAMPIEARCKIIRKFGDLVWSHQQEALRTIRQETGKSDVGAYGEVNGVDVTVSYYAHAAPSLLKREKRSTLFPIIEWAHVYHKPHGIVGLIAPWNYPLMIPAWELIPALLAGNTVIIKPSEQAPFSTFFLADMLNQAGLPDNVLQIITGDGKIGQALIDQVDYVAFTGSTRVGKMVAKQAAERLIPYSVELGGKNPMLVLRDADLDMAATGLFAGAFVDAWQACITIERVYLEEAVYDAFLEKVKHYSTQFHIGSGDGFDVHIGSLNSEVERQRTEDHIQDALDQGATLLWGGKRRPDLGPLFFEPAILINTKPSMRVMQEETFGPVVSITPVADVEEAIRQASNTEYGLNAAIYTRDLQHGERIATRLNCGFVEINHTLVTLFSPQLPWGGQKQSGVGRRGGPEGLLRFTTTQSVLVETNIGLTPHLTALSPVVYFGLRVMHWVRRLIPSI